MKSDKPVLSFVVIDSRSDEHPDWVSDSVRSVQTQNIPIELKIVNNVGRKHTIGKCWNAGVKSATCDWVVFLGDDDFVSHDYAKVLWD